ncbi:hypothetical protein FGIG_06068 [Fasciola gigantica]|uniref:TOG domain-containing protein n=1 Tax=Fasciola gigantica TaxID=46835 RepID=A0A504YJ84_FASGI|nr:hypothetical protein FGIG_06068 [Fasciola gigantica]
MPFLLSVKESSQWRERGDSLDYISRCITGSSLPAGNYNSVVRALLQVLETDKHNALVVRAANVVEQLIRGLGSSYAAFAERTLTACLNKAKAISSPAPGIQIEATNLLTQCLILHNPHTKQGTELNVSQRTRIVKPLLTTLAKISQHRTPECREASFQAFAAARLFLDMPSPGFTALTDGLLDEQRRLKVDVAYDLLQSEQKKLLKQSEHNPASLGSVESSELRETKKDRKRRNVKKNRVSVDITDNSSPSVTRSVASARRPLQEKNREIPDSTNHTAPGVVPTPLKQASKPSGKCARQVARNSAEDISWNNLCDLLSSDYLSGIDMDQLKSSNWKCRLQTVEKLKTNVTARTPSGQQTELLLLHFGHPERPLNRTINFQLKSSNWKCRLQTVEKLKTNVTARTPSGQQTELLLHFVIQSDRLKDINFQVRNIVLDILLFLISTTKATKNSSLDDNLVGLLCSHVIPSLVDSKSSTLAKQILSRLASVSSVTGHLFSVCQGSIKPQLLAAVHDWLADNTLKLGLKFNLNEVVTVLKTAFASSNPAVRNGGIRFAARAHMVTKSSGQLRQMLSGEKPALLARLDEEIILAENEFAQLTTADRSSRCARRSLRSSDALSSCSSIASSATAGSVQPARADLTILKGDAAFVNQLMMDSGSASDSDAGTDHSHTHWNETTPIKGVIQRADPQSAGPAGRNANSDLFFVQSGQTTELMSRKQARLPNLNKNLCIDLVALRQLFHEANANPNLLQSLFSTNRYARLEALDRLIACLDSADSALADPPALTVTYAFFDLLLAWTVGACFTFWLDCQIESQSPSLPTRTEALALVTGGLQYLTVVVSRFAQAQFLLSDQEADLILHSLLSDQAPSLRSGLMNQGIDQSVRACLQELTSLLPRFGDARGFNLPFALKLVAQQIADPVPVVRQSALDCLGLAHRLLGADIWNVIGPLTCHNFISSSSRRVASPPPVHQSPAALSVLVPLINLRNGLHISDAMRQAASEKLNTALTCLVRQLDVSPFRSGASTVAAAEDNSDEPTAGMNDEPTQHTDKSHTMPEDDESDALNNVLLGALVDLETLVLDPRSCELLVPFVNAIVNRLASLARCLAHTERNAGHTVFTNCLAGTLIVVRAFPFLVALVVLSLWLIVTYL